MAALPNQNQRSRCFSCHEANGKTKGIRHRIVDENNSLIDLMSP